MESEEEDLLFFPLAEKQLQYGLPAKPVVIPQKSKHSCEEIKSPVNKCIDIEITVAVVYKEYEVKGPLTSYP